MANELDEFIRDHNNLHDKINKVIQQKDSDNALLIRIDAWQKTTIEKVKQVAEQARQQVVNLLNSKTMEIKTQFEKFSQEFIQLKETENFVENNLKRLAQTMHQLNQDLIRLNQPPEIELHIEQTNQIPWDRLIYIEEKPERQQYVNEQKQAVASSYQNKLNCKGLACSKCGKCSDWYYINDHYEKCNGATCNRDYVSNLFLDDALSSIYDDTLYSNDDDESLYHGQNVICQCKK